MKLKLLGVTGTNGRLPYVISWKRYSAAGKLRRPSARSLPVRKDLHHAAHTTPESLDW